MRVIAGTRRGTVLKAPEGMSTRPTTDRTKETLFNILMPYVADAVVADFFSGSGAIAIEALSRGAKCAYLVEKDRKAAMAIKQNLEKTRFTEEAEVITTDVFEALRRMEKEKIRFDLIFMDPPYNKGLEKELLEKMSCMDIFSGSAVVVAEASLETSFDYIESFGYEKIKEKKYKTNQHVFLRRMKDGCGSES